MVQDSKWGTWKDHGNATSLVYFGQYRRKPWAEGKPATVTKDAAGISVLDAATGKPFANDLVGGWRGFASRFHAAPAPSKEDSEVTDEQTGTAAAEDPEMSTDGQVGTKEGGLYENKQLPGKSPAKAAKPTAGKQAKPTAGKCRCGCGQAVGGKSTFKQGHDARWISSLVAKVLQDKMTLDAARQATGEVSEALRTKLSKAVDNARDKARKAERAKEAKAAAKAQEAATG